MKIASSASEVRATERQLDEYQRYVVNAAKSGAEIALKKVAPSKDRMQEILEGEELKNAIRNAVIETTQRLSRTNEFANEEVPSKYGYLSGYQGPKSVADQVSILRGLFPDIDFGTFDEALAQLVVEGTEGAFAIPDWHLFGSTYGEAVQKLFGALKKVYRGKFHNYREGQLGPAYLRQHARTIAKLEQLTVQQSGHRMMIVFAQFGIRHRGRSVRRAREVFISSEFGLGAFAIGIMLLTHHERLQNVDDLWIDCAGDEFSPDADGQFVCAPIYLFSDGLLEFDAGWVSLVNDDFGSASGFLPQQP